MFCSVLLPPSIVLFVSDCTPVNVTTVESIAIVTGTDPLKLVPDNPVPIVNEFASAAVTVTVPPKLTGDPLIVMLLFTSDALGILDNVFSDALIVTPVNEVMVDPSDTAVDPMVIELLVNDALPMFESVLAEPLIVLLVKVCAPVKVAVTVGSIEIVPVDVIGPPVKPRPVLINVIPVTSAPFDAAVIRPFELTVMLAFVYEPGTTVESLSEITTSEPAPLSV